MTVNEIGYEIGYNNRIENDFQERIRRKMGNNPYSNNYNAAVEELQKFFDSLDMEIPKALTDTYNPNFRGNVEWFLVGIHNGSVARHREKREE